MGVRAGRRFVLYQACPHAIRPSPVHSSPSAANSQLLFSRLAIVISVPGWSSHEPARGLQHSGGGNRQLEVAVLGGSQSSRRHDIIRSPIKLLRQNLNYAEAVPFDVAGLGIVTKVAK